MSDRRFTCRIEELHPLAGFLRVSYVRDGTDFRGHSPVYNGQFLIDYDAKMSAVDTLLNPGGILGALKTITIRLYSTMESMRDHLNKVENFISLCRQEDLTLDKNSFGISEVRNEITQGDAEGYDGKMRIFLDNVQANFTALEVKGLTQTRMDDMTTNKASVKEDNKKQNEKLDAVEILAQSNLVPLNDLWDSMVQIMKTGKALYKESDEVRTEDYTMTKLVERIRQEFRHTKPPV